MFQFLEEYPVGGMSLDDFSLKYQRVALAFSGGCDSSYLLAALSERGVEVKPYVVNTAFQASFELEDAKRVAQEVGVSLNVLDADVLSRADVCANTSDRCYLCKHFIFSTIMRQMNEDGYEFLVDGTNASDDPARRPGFRALKELGVLSPLRLAGMTKDDVREASGKMGLFTSDKPSFSCLATKVEEGKPLTAKSLSAITDRLERYYPGGK